MELSAHVSNTSVNTVFIFVAVFNIKRYRMQSGSHAFSCQTPGTGVSVGALLLWENNYWFGTVLCVVLYPLDARCSWGGKLPPV